MILIWIPVSILILYVLLNMVYARLWKKGLSVELSFEEKDAAEGDTATLVETVTNDKFLPLPVLKISFKMDRGLIVDEDRNASVSDMTNVVEYFGLSSREQVIRRQPVRALRRGYYVIRTAGLVMPDFFSVGTRHTEIPQDTALMVLPSVLASREISDLSRRIVGEILSRRRLYQDVFSFRGIREYVPGDPQSMINWKASARSGDYMVNLRDYTSGQELRLLLNLEVPAIRYQEDLLENSIRLAYTLAGDGIRQGVPVSLATNGRDLITDREVSLEAGSSQSHLGALGQGLARVSLALKPRPFDRLLEEERKKPVSDQTTFCMISAGQSDALIREAAALSQKCGGLVWICPMDPDVERKPIPSGITFIPVEVSHVHTGSLL